MNEIWTQEEEANRLRARFERLKSEKDMGQAEFARIHKVPGGASLLSQHILNRRPINLGAATAYANGFGCSIGDISPRLAKEVAQASLISPAAQAGHQLSAITDRVGEPADLSIPLLSWVRAGDFCEAPGQFSASDAEEFLPRPLFNTSRKTFALLVRGDSMDVSGGYREGEIVYIDPDVSPTPGRDVLAKTESGMTLKRYKEDEDGPYLLQLNGNKIIRPANWHVCGVVVFSGQRR